MDTGKDKMEKGTIIGVVGLIGAGKGTVAEHLVNQHNFIPDSFASTLKDACAVMFSWPRHLLEGDTTESREWREITDTWWSVELGIPNFTPRLALQIMGTDTIRNNFHQDMWLLTMKHRIQAQPNKNVVISDARFPNEINLIKESGGIIVQVTRGAKPAWYDIAEAANHGDENAQLQMKTIYSDIHFSEWAWIGTQVDYEVSNDGAVIDLHAKLDLMLGNVS